MNDAQRLVCERFFDGELPEVERAVFLETLAADPAAQRYLEQLKLLRTLASQHNPLVLRVNPRPVEETVLKPSSAASANPSDLIRLVGVEQNDRAARKTRFLRSVGIAVGSLGAIAAGLLLGLGFSGRPPTPEKVVSTSPVSPSVSRPKPTKFSGNNTTAKRSVRVMETELARWANASSTDPGTIAKLVLNHRSSHRRRSSQEMLVHKLVNGESADRDILQRLAASRDAKSLRSSSRRSLTAPRRADSTPPRA